MNRYKNTPNLCRHPLYHWSARDKQTLQCFGIPPLCWCDGFCFHHALNQEWEVQVIGCKSGLYFMDWSLAASDHSLDWVHLLCWISNNIKLQLVASTSEYSYRHSVFHAKDTVSIHCCWKCQSACFPSMNYNKWVKRDNSTSLSHHGADTLVSLDVVNCCVLLFAVPEEKLMPVCSGVWQLLSVQWHHRTGTVVTERCSENNAAMIAEHERCLQMKTLCGWSF